VFISLPFPSFSLYHTSPALAPWLPIKSSQICGNIIKYVQEDVTAFEKCLQALIFPSETAALPLPQRRRLESTGEIFTYTPLKKKAKCKQYKKIRKAGVGDRLQTPSQKTQEVSSKVSTLGIKKNTIIK